MKLFIVFFFRILIFDTKPAFVTRYDKENKKME